MQAARKIDYFEFRCMREVTIVRDGFYIGTNWMQQVDLTDVIQYSQDYWNKYIEYEEHEMDHKLNEYRFNFVKDAEIVYDIGIGSGSFIKYCQEQGKECYGYDVNPYAVEWLKENNIYKDLSEIRPKWATTCWDSLEHMPNLVDFLEFGINKWQRMIFSMPLLPSVAIYPNWKHFRPQEHLHLFTRSGIEDILQYYDYDILGIYDGEINCGREDIYTIEVIKKG